MPSVPPPISIYETAIRERDEARAQAVAATTDADDLQAKLRTMHQSEGVGAGQEFPWCIACDRVWPCPTTRALDAAESAGSVHTGDSSASVDPSATPDLLGPQIGAESLRARVEAAIAPWPPGPRKGDVYRALGEDR